MTAGGEGAVVEEAIQENRRALESFLARAGVHAREGWHTPRAAGKWSPAQVAEHVALGYEVSEQIVRGGAVGPAMPRFVRPLLRALFLKRLLRTGKFPANAKAPRVFAPADRPAAAEVLLPRIRAAAKAFEAAVAQVAAGAAPVDRAAPVAGSARDARVEHPVFGKIGLADYVRFVSVHTRHHERQFPSTAAASAS